MARKSQWRLIAESVKAKRLQKRTFTLKIGENSVGRLKKCDIPIPSKLCSRHHCDIHVDGEIITLRDHSQIGTFVNEALVLNEVAGPLNSYDKIGLGLVRNMESTAFGGPSYIYSLVRDSGEVIEIIASDDDAGDGDAGDADNDANAASAADDGCSSSTFKATPMNFYSSASMATGENEVSSSSANDNPGTVAIETNTAERHRAQSEISGHLTTKPTQPSTVKGYQASQSGQQTSGQAEIFKDKRIQRQTVKRQNTYLPEVGESFKTKVKVKVAKYSRGEMLIADMLSSRDL